jgi:hypothetical protein
LKARIRAAFVYSRSKAMWMVSTREHMDAGDGAGFMRVKSTAATPDQIIQQWVGRFRVLGSPPAPLLGHPWNLV